MKVNHKDLGKLLHRAYKTKTPLFVVGGIGIGKSQTIEAVSKEIAKESNKEFRVEASNKDEDFCLIDRRASQFDTTDLRGLPMKDGDVISWCKPDFLAKKGQGILFFDEINLAPPLVQSTLYSLILDRKIDEYTLPDGYCVIGAGNRIEDKSNVFEMSMALANRFIHCELQPPSVEEWTDWATKHNVNPMIVGFLNFKRSLLYNINPDSQELAQPTPRQWVRASEMIDGITNHEDQEMYVSSAVGEGASLEFMAFSKLSEKIDLKNLLKNPNEIQKITDLSVKYSVMSALASYFADDKKSLPSILKICNLIEPEFSALLFRLVHSMDSSYVLTHVSKSKDWVKFANMLEKYVDLV